MTLPTNLVPQVEASLLPPPARRQWVQRLRLYFPALVVFVAGLLLWEAVVTVFKIEQFLLPKPSVIWATFQVEAAVVIPAGLFTLREALGGFVLGSTLAIGMALLIARWAFLSEGMMPFAILVNSAPMVALAPIMNQWFGITNPLGKMSIVAVIVYFPVLINMVRGLTQVEPTALELMRSYAASEATILAKVRAPNALPYLFSALKVSSTLSIIGAIVSEYFGGARDALGVYISQQAALFHFAEAWAAILVASLMGVAFYGAILLVERWLMPWHTLGQADD